MRHLASLVIVLIMLALAPGLTPAIVQAGGPSSTACPARTVCDRALGVALSLPAGWMQLHPPKVPPHVIALVMRPTNGLCCAEYTDWLHIAAWGTTQDRNAARAANVGADRLINGFHARLTVTRTPVRYGGAPGVLIRGLPPTPAPALDIVLAHGSALYLIIAPGTALRPDQRAALASLRFIPRVGPFPSVNPVAPSGPSSTRTVPLSLRVSPNPVRLGQPITVTLLGAPPGKMIVFQAAPVSHTGFGGGLMGRYQAGAAGTIRFTYPAFQKQWEVGTWRVTASRSGSLLASDLIQVTPSQKIVTFQPAPCRTVIAPALVYALKGAIYRVDPSGRNLCRVSTFIGAKEPRLSPGGTRIAFLSGVGRYGDGHSHGNTVHVVRVGGPISSGTVIPVGRGLHGQLAWSPDGQKLAFLGQSGVWEWRIACGCVRLALPSKGDTLHASFAWSPDSRRLAAYLLPAVPSSASTHLALQVADLTTGRRSTITVKFPSWLTGPRPYSGSYPTGVVAWLPNGSLLLRTSGWGVGVSLTSLWLAPWTGGMARMTVGTYHAQQIGLKFPLLNSTQALVSPDGTRLLLDPDRALWIRSTTGGGGRTIKLPIHGSCALSQIAWVSNSRVAYVTVCSTPGEGMIPILARLYELSLTGSAPIQVASMRS